MENKSNKIIRNEKKKKIRLNKFRKTHLDTKVPEMATIVRGAEKGKPDKIMK